MMVTRMYVPYVPFSRDLESDWKQFIAGLSASVVEGFLFVVSSFWGWPLLIRSGAGTLSDYLDAVLLAAAYGHAL